MSFGVFNRLPVERMGERVACGLHPWECEYFERNLFELGRLFRIDAIGRNEPGDYGYGYRNAVLLQYSRAQLTARITAPLPFRPVLETVAVHMGHQEPDSVFGRRVRNRHLREPQRLPEKTKRIYHPEGLVPKGTQHREWRQDIPAPIGDGCGIRGNSLLVGYLQQQATPGETVRHQRA